MPKSKVRKKDSSSLDGDRQTSSSAQAALGPSSPIYITAMLGLMLIGLLWLVVNYLAGDKIGFMTDLGSWNFAIGFAFIIIGLLMTMRWR